MNIQEQLDDWKEFRKKTSFDLLPETDYDTSMEALDEAVLILKEIAVDNNGFNVNARMWLKKWRIR